MERLLRSVWPACVEAASRSYAMPLFFLTFVFSYSLIWETPSYGRGTTWGRFGFSLYFVYIRFDFKFWQLPLVIPMPVRRKADVLLRGYSGFNTRWALCLLNEVFPLVLAERWIAYCASYGSCRLCAGFIHSHVSLALKKRGDGIIGLDNFNNYYPVALKRARAENPKLAGIFVVEGDINDQQLLELFGLVVFTHVLHLAAQAGVRYAVHNPLAYVHSNVGGFVTLLEQCKREINSKTFQFCLM